MIKLINYSYDRDQRVQQATLKAVVELIDKLVKEEKDGRITVAQCGSDFWHTEEWFNELKKLAEVKK